MPVSPESITPERLASGAFVRAVLDCNRALDPTQPEVEVLELPLLLGQGDNVWAFSRSAHGPISPLGPQSGPCAYGYSTHYGLVANAAHLEGTARVYGLAAYAVPRFVAVSGGAAIWQGEGDDAALKAAIEAGAKLRAVVETAAGLTLGLDIHLAEYHGAGNIALYTDYDAVPAFVLAPEFLARLAAEIEARQAARGDRPPLITGLLEPQKTGFHSLYFRLNSGGSIAGWDAATGRFDRAELWRRLAVFAR